MRKLALLLLFALPLVAADFDNIVIRDGNTSFNYGGDRDGDGLGRRYAYFEKDGVAYAITDAATLKRILAELRPQMELGEEQARIGAEQARIGGMQAAVGAEQAAIGAQQAAHWDDQGRARELEAAQRKLQRRQEQLAEQQRPLAEKQQALAEKQREAADRAKKRIEAIFEEALRGGTAKRR
jgi:hypothetical protein